MRDQQAWARRALTIGGFRPPAHAAARRLVDISCFGVAERQGAVRFYAMWWARVVGTPLLLMGCVSVYCSLAPLKKPVSEAWHSASSLVLFLVRARSCPLSQVP